MKTTNLAEINAVRHRRYTDADDALRVYERLRRAASSVKAQAPLGRGEEPGARCARSSCPRPTRFEDRGGVKRCACCGALWPIVEVDTLSGGGPRSPAGVASAMHDRLAEVSLLGRLLNDRPAKLSAVVWDLQRAAWMLATIRGRTPGYIAAALSHRLARAGIGVSARTVERLIRDVREEVEDRLARRGLLETRVTSARVLH